jgi:hypothetical protein
MTWRAGAYSPEQQHDLRNLLSYSVGQDKRMLTAIATEQTQRSTTVVHKPPLVLILLAAIARTKKHLTKPRTVALHKLQPCWSRLPPNPPTNARCECTITEYSSQPARNASSLPAEALFLEHVVFCRQNQSQTLQRCWSASCLNIFADWRWSRCDHRQ